MHWADRMADFPTGTVTFLFTDIEGSTRLAQTYPQAMPGMLARHNEILQKAIEAHHGSIFQRVGDSFSAAFHSAIDAVQAALEAQRCLFSENWPAEQVRVRMGIHTGTVQLTGANQYSGYTTLALTQRIMSAGHGGQVLLSGATRELVRDFLPPDTELIDLGEKRLKDLLRPEHIYQLNGPTLPSDFPPLRTLDSSPNNLPVQLTTFIGREKEILDVEQELSRHRLVTLTGSGGTGKTRLSLQVAADLLGQFDHGIWFVELAPLVDPELIPHTIVAAMGIREQAGKPALELLKEYLHDKKILILLDNCEHLIEASARLAGDVLNAAPQLKILASSREALGVPGELSYPVPSLSLPNMKQLPVIEQLSQYESVRLFIDRASLVSPHFEVDRENAPAIAQICYRLDGIPLAIELAAARVKVMTVEQISKRLDDRFRLLTGGARTALPRQQTLRALIDWSYDLLSENERLLLRRLSAFAGSWTLEAAEQICAGDGIETYDVLDLLSQLVHKSLVVANETTQVGEMRYRMLETIRQYAREKLLESGEGETVRDNHFGYYLKMAAQAKAEFAGPGELIWLVWLSYEWDNIRAAVEWSIERQPSAGLELVNNLGFIFLDSLNNLRDMENWLSALLAQPENRERSTRRARGLLHWSWYASANREEAVPVQSMIDESISIYEETNDRNGLAHAYLVTALSTEDLAVSGEFCDRALHLFRETGDKFGAGFALLYFGWAMGSHDNDRKRASLEESLAIHRELGFVSGIIESSKQYAALEIRLGNFEAAHRRLEEGYALLEANASRLGNSITMAFDLGDLAYHEEKYELAQKYFEESLSWSSQKGLPYPAAWARARLGYLYTRLGEVHLASSFLREALISFHKGGAKISIIFVLEGVASLAVAEKQWERAAILYSCATEQRNAISEPRPPVEAAAVERDLAILREQLDGLRYDKAFETGRTLILEEAVTFALER